MESFRIVTDAGTEYAIHVQEVTHAREELVRTLIEIDLQTFSESTFSHYTAAAFLRYGRVFLLSADDVVIGTCVCMRCWDRPTTAKQPPARSRRCAAGWCRSDGRCRVWKSRCATRRAGQ